MGIFKKKDTQIEELEVSIENLHQFTTTQEFLDYTKFEQEYLERNLATAQNMLAHLRITFASTEPCLVKGE